MSTEIPNWRGASRIAGNVTTHHSFDRIKVAYDSAASVFWTQGPDGVWVRFPELPPTIPAPPTRWQRLVRWLRRFTWWSP